MLIAIDPGTNQTGYAIGVESEATPLHYGVFRPKKHTNHVLAFWELMSQHRPIDKVYIEHPWVGRNAATAMTLAKLCGHYEAVMLLERAEIFYIQPSEWQPVMFPVKHQRRTVSKSTKILSKERASQLLGNSIKNDNIADAVCLWCYAALCLKEIHAKL